MNYTQPSCTKLSFEALIVCFSFFPFRLLVSVSELGTELGNGDRPASQEAEDESVVWNVKIFPLLQELESIVAGSVLFAMNEPQTKVQTDVSHITFFSI